MRLACGGWRTQAGAKAPGCRREPATPLPQHPSTSLQGAWQFWKQTRPLRGLGVGVRVWPDRWSARPLCPPPWALQDPLPTFSPGIWSAPGSGRPSSLRAERPGHFTLTGCAGARPDLTASMCSLLLSWGVPLAITMAAVALKKIGYDASDVSVGWCWINLEAEDYVLWMLLTGKLWEMLAYIMLPLLYLLVRKHISRAVGTLRGPVQSSVWPLGPGIGVSHPGRGTGQSDKG